MALDQFVTAVQNLSAQGNYVELCDHLNKSVEVRKYWSLVGFREKARLGETRPRQE